MSVLEPSLHISGATVIVAVEPFQPLLSAPVLLCLSVEREGRVSLDSSDCIGRAIAALSAARDAI